MATRDQAIDHLQRFAALTAEEAIELVDAVRSAAADEAVDAIAEELPLPSALGDARAARVVRICRSLDPPRLLRPIEVATIFRVQPTVARQVINRVRAGYPHIVDAWTRELISQQANPPIDISDEELRDQWRLTFNDPIVLD